jgi:single-stranded DNA-specific DHH superfamily exonuclease
MNPETKAKKFLSQINPDDKIAIIHHDDGDGFCSGIILNNFCKLQNAKTKTLTFNNKNSTLKKFNLKKFNKIIITDVPAKVMQPELHLIKNKQILYIDHHEKINLPNKIQYYPTVDQGYIPCSRTAYELTNLRPDLALIGTISDSGDLYKENLCFIKKQLKNLNLSLEEFKTKYAHPFCDTIIYFKKKPNKAFKILSQISSLKEIFKIKKYADKAEKEIQKTVKKFKEKKKTYGEINLYIRNKKSQGKEIAVAIISKAEPKKIHLFLGPQNKKYIGISARDQTKNANLPKLLEILTDNLPYAKVGGHPRASGGQILKKDLKQFIQNIKDYAKK